MLRRIATISAVTAGIIGAFVVPASAHDTSQTVWVGAPPAIYAAGRGGVDSNHLRVWAQDTAADDKGVRTYYWTEGGGYDVIGDGNGSKSGRGEKSSYNGRRIVSFQVCVGSGPETCTAVFGA